VTLGAMLASASPAAAQPRAQPETGAPVDLGGAKAEFAAAQKLFKAGRFAEALPLFRSVADSTKSPNAQLYVGHCLEQVGKVVDAYKVFELIVKEITEHPEEKYEPTREAAMAQLAVLQVRVAKIVVSLTEIPPDVTVTLDGSRVEEKDLGSSIVVAPGAHRVEATGGGVAPVRRDVNLDGGEVKTVILSPKKADDGRTKTEPPVVEAKTDASSGGSMRAIGYVAGGIGVFGVGVFAVTGLMAKSTFDKLDEECKKGCSDSGHLGDIDRGKSLQTTANVGLVIGLVGIGTGVTLIVLGSGKGSDSPAARSGPSVSLSAGGGSVWYTGHF
jgi:hypothetical protein